MNPIYIDQIGNQLEKIYKLLFMNFLSKPKIIMLVF